MASSSWQREAQQTVSQRPIVIVVHALGVGGVTNAIFDQSKLFVEAGHPTTILTLNYVSNFEDTVRDRRASGRLNSAVVVRNAYTDLQASASGGAGLAQRAQRILDRAGEHRRDEPGLVASHGKDKRGEFSRYFQRDGTYVKYKRWDSPTAVRQITYFRDRKPVAKVDYAPTGWAHRHITLDPASGNPVEERFLTETGRAYLIRWVDPETERSQAVYSADKGGQELIRHSGLPAWHSHHIAEVCREFDQRPIVMAEAPSAVPKVGRIDPSVASRVGMLHNNQFAAPHTVGSPIRADHEEIFGLLPSLDALVVLTAQQKGDIVDLCGEAEKIHVIPNLREVPDMPAQVTKDPRLVSVVSRLSAQKSLHEAIHAFQMVLRRVPDARLEIYGGGTTERLLRDTITELGLEEQVQMMGRTPEPELVMARSVCTVSSSEWEAMPLSIVESAAVGTPVVAYDCLYGPRALIDDGRTGYIVPKGDRQALADRIVELLEDPDRAASMGRAAQADFRATNTPEVVAPKWQRFLSDL